MCRPPEATARKAGAAAPSTICFKAARTNCAAVSNLGETAGFPILDELRQEGETDYFAMVQRFDKEAAIGEMDCFMSRWTTTRPGRLQRCRYRGAAPAGSGARPRHQVGFAGPRRPVAGRGLSRARCRPARACRASMSRGAAERINAVIWFSDMQGYTSLSERIDLGRAHPAAQRLCRSRRSRPCTAPAATC